MHNDLIAFSLTTVKEPVHKLVLLYILFYNNKHEKVPTVKQISDYLECEVDKVKEAIKVLKDKGFLVGSLPYSIGVLSTPVRYPRKKAPQKVEKVEKVVKVEKCIPVSTLNEHTEIFSKLLNAYRVAVNNNPRATLKRLTSSDKQWVHLCKAVEYLEGTYPGMDNKEREKVYREFIVIVHQEFSKRKFGVPFYNQLHSDQAKQMYESHLVSGSPLVQKDDNLEATEKFAEEYLKALKKRSSERLNLTVDKLLQDKDTRQQLFQARRIAENCGVKYRHFVEAQFSYFRKTFNSTPTLTQFTTQKAGERALSWVVESFPSGEVR